MFDTDLPLTQETWLQHILPKIQSILNIPDDDEQIVSFWYNQGLRSADLDLTNIIQSFYNNKILCFGASPELEEYSSIARNAKEKGIGIASADGATRFLLNQGVIPDIVVSDLDGITLGDIKELLNSDVKIQVLTHGDNKNKVQTIVDNIDEDDLSKISFSTQGRPILNWKNTLGFTDGDRLVCLLSHYNSDIFLVGYNLNSELIGRYSKPEFKKHQPINQRKRNKLAIAKEVLHWVNNHHEFSIENSEYGPGKVRSIDDFLG